MGADDDIRRQDSQLKSFRKTLIDKYQEEDREKRLKVSRLIPSAFDLHILKASLAKQPLNGRGVAAIVIDVKFHDAT